ncbi:2-hydroxychromene-2-carboxylate isomerase [Acidisphaera rubrifaciens]|uniref:2-hydroxychromene-2-carboxylate isomerase n=1 Tax=Acidisphaera rubrifaciens HS-AP3 TaxID=1231350 RepID=A0A0D6P5V3_9PROT|nr:DsbA family protein [Acidisphaera rubrifaciens]GAN76254.1 2-hydroxychromene-2-carboxylate isomerase [Acidisphaera rubrifaciens HS-AP3]
MPARVRVYTDYKSPYAYVANAALFDLERTHGVTLEWLPYTLRIDEFMGPVETRTPHFWRKVRYSYMDARRFAGEQGLVLKGPKRIYDATLASAGMLYAQRHGFFRPYHDAVFAAFWDRRLDIDDLGQMSALVAALGGDAADYAAYARGEGRERVAAITAEAEELGVFGVPSMILDGELFWGNDRIPLLTRRIEERDAGR